MKEGESVHVRFYIDIPRRDGAPKVGEYIVTVGKKGYGSAYLIVGLRAVAHRTPRTSQRYNLRCQRAELAEALGICWEIRWYSRDRKKRKEHRVG